MNLARVLDQETTLLPPSRLAQSYPRLHPRLTVREHQEHDGKVFISVIPGGRPPLYFRMNAVQWHVATLFNGERSYAEVAQLASQQLGTAFAEEEIRGFADLLDRDNYWYRTPQEESAALCQKLMSDRHEKLTGRSDHGDLSQIILYSFDPDKYLEWVIRHFNWVYSRWFMAWSLFMVAVMFAILGSRWDQVWSDSVNFYALTGRGAWHVVEFFAIFVALGAIHETAHGMTCKHFGGEVHRIGAMMVYLCPAIFCDVSHIYAHGGRWERITTVFAGVWSEVVLCSYASVVWWATPPGTVAHQAA
jgi:putative peptide zinc metalloprotease protein